MAGNYSTEQLTTRRTRFEAVLPASIILSTVDLGNFWPVPGDLGMIWKRFPAGALLAHVHSRRTRTAWDSRAICNRWLRQGKW